MNNTLLATTIAVLMSASALPALAQDAAAGTDVGAGVNVETPAGDAAVDAAAGADAMDSSFNSVAAAISGAADTDLSAVTDESKVTIVLLSSLSGDAATEGADLDSAISANAEAMTSLHANIDGNAAIKAKLEAEGYTSADVVAVQSAADGAATVYVDDRS